MPAQVVAIGQPENDFEREVIARLRDELSDAYTILHNFEIEDGQERFEVDLAVIAPHSVFVIDVKGVHGRVEVYGNQWFPERRAPYPSPMPKLRQHAKRLKTLIVGSCPGNRDLASAHVDAVVVLAAPGAYLVDHAGKDKPDVVSLAEAPTLLKGKSRIPDHRSHDIRTLHDAIRDAIQGKSRPPSGLRQVGNWVLQEKLTADSWRGTHAFAGGSPVLVRFYGADPYLPEDERKQQVSRIANAYKALSALPSHPGIVAVRDFTPTEAEDRFALVTEDPAGQALRPRLGDTRAPLTFDQKARIARDLLGALAHAHAHGVVHRNLHPGTILVCDDGQTRLAGFDYARAGKDRSSTIAEFIAEELEEAYQALECFADPGAASPASDVFSAGLVIYELFAGEPAFADAAEMERQHAVFAEPISAKEPALPVGCDAWLQSLCAKAASDRPAALAALGAFEKLLRRTAEGNTAASTAPSVDYRNLPTGYSLTSKYVVQERLGEPGGFGVAYRVIDTLGDVSRVVKLVLQDRHSKLDRLKKEYRILLRLPPHPRVVKVVNADILPGEDGPPYIVFEYIEGQDVGEMIASGTLSITDAWELGRQVAEGLVHLHASGVYHGDIKPRNLLWTADGARIIDFNVSTRSGDDGHGGGSRRYLAPDLDTSHEPTEAERAERDVYALGITLYEALTGEYPWQAKQPPPGKPAKEPHKCPRAAELSAGAAELLRKALAPKRADRFASALELLDALTATAVLRPKPPQTEESSTWTVPELGAPQPNTNPFVSYLLTLYSQGRCNSGTRGLDALGERTYLETALDRELLPAVLGGEFGLVIITGNAGDGKTAFLQRVEAGARERGTDVLAAASGSGASFALDGRRFISNYDGSQDEGDRTNDAVLAEFLGSYGGADSQAWPTDETRLIAINEGRLTDFLETHGANYPLLRRIVQQGLGSGQPDHGVAVVNLNLRSVVASGPDDGGSILARLVRRLTHPKFWMPCEQCKLRDKCYVLHNVRTFQDMTAGPKVAERLQALYLLTDLRGRLHITLRDLRSAIAFMLTGARDCLEIHGLYGADGRKEIMRGYYYNSWMGNAEDTDDRLLSLLQGMDMGVATDPALDRRLDFLVPTQERALFGFGDRSNYELALLKRAFEELPREVGGHPGEHRFAVHRQYTAMLRRRQYFERRDDGWREMLPYRRAKRMLEVIRGELAPEQLLPELIRAINRGEGIVNPDRLQGCMALQVRDVANGTIRSYRLFPSAGFSLRVRDDGRNARFVEWMPTALVLGHSLAKGQVAELEVSLDVFEMLCRLNEGYRPTVEETQGYYLSLAIFKNVLGSAPYQELLLTTTGHDFFRIERHEDGQLELGRVTEGGAKHD